MDLSGIYPPIATPFTDDELDLAALKHNLSRWMGTGLRGVLALGSNGEAALVDEDEAERYVGAARDEMPRDRLLLVGTGRQSTRATITATRRAARAGADAALVVTPFFYKSAMTADALLHHYRAVADASPMPIVLYNVTGFTGVNLPVDVVAQLAEHPNVVGLKDSNGDVAQVADAVSRVPAGFSVLVGSAPTLFPAMMVGAVGGIVGVAGVVPDLCVRLFDLVRAGRYDEARVLQQRLTPLARSVTTVYGPAGLKAAMEMTGYRGGVPRPPLRPVATAALEVLRRQIDALLAA